MKTIVKIIILVALPIILASNFLTIPQRQSLGDVFALYLVIGIPVILYPQILVKLFNGVVSVFKPRNSGTKSENSAVSPNSSLRNPIYWIIAIAIVLWWKWEEISTYL